MFKKDLINSVYQSISQLRYIDVNDNDKYDLDSIIRAYRGVFGEEYTHNNDDIIAEEVRRDVVDNYGIKEKEKDRSFSQFLSNHHCCWIDFIGSDSFSCGEKKQVFFSTVSMSRKDVDRREKFLKEYNRLLAAGVPVDIFVQLFFSDIDQIKENETLKKDELKCARVIQLLKEIQCRGLLISFGEGIGNGGIVSTQIVCSPVESESELRFDENTSTSKLNDEIVQFLDAMIEGRDVSPLVKGVATLNRSLHKKVQYLYFKPLHSPDGAIGLFCYGSKKLLNWKELRELLIFAFNIMSPFVSAYKSAWENQQIIKESIKSAVSAIMSRNMSHNLGSHYLYYTKAHLESLADDNEEIGPDIRGVAKVLSYMQARMDYLATIISNDKYPNGSVNFKAQLFDELTVDDFSKRHFQSSKDISKRTTNFLLSNLILSENFSRSSIRSNNQYCDSKEPYMLLRLQSMLWNSQTGRYDLFTGSALSADEIDEINSKGSIVHKLVSIKDEEAVKDELSRINFAMPGGSMSCHAFFNILENFIRNSAKYLQEDFIEEEGLVITIAIKRNDKDTTKFDILFFDNKQNANKIHETNSGEQKTLIQDINDQLSGLRILDEFNGIEKSSKGLKEMLFSAIWMRTYNYPKQTFADIIDAIHREKKDKLKLINKYGFSVVPVSNDGVICEEDINANLGVQFTLPEFVLLTKPDIDIRGDETEQINKCLGVYADIIELDSSLNPDKNDGSKKDNQVKAPIKLEDFFTRVFYSDDFDEKEYEDYVNKSHVLIDDKELSAIAYRYKKILDRRLCSDDETIDSYTLKFGGAHFEKNEYSSEKDKCIYFKRHLSTTTKLENFKNYAYADSVSGGNMTITLSTLFENGTDRGYYKSWRDKIFGYKIKESALTRITLIDERLFNNMKGFGPSKELELSLKRIRILNLNPKRINEADTLAGLFDGNTFLDGSSKTHFLSIHLGLIEKIVKSTSCRFLASASVLEDRVNLLMQELRRFFSDGENDVFISVHSGRGNFSKELEGPLANYPFISLPAIETALSNSKYLLSQLFYNTAYIGKGRINKKHK